jgi:hypothetical protein
MPLTLPSSHYVSVFNAIMELKQQGLNPDRKTLGPYLSASRGLELEEAEIARYVADFITRGFRVLDAAAYIRNYTFC